MFRGGGAECESPWSAGARGRSAKVVDGIEAAGAGGAFPVVVAAEGSTEGVAAGEDGGEL